MTINFKLPAETISFVGKDLSGIKSDIDSIRLPPAAKKILHAVQDKIIERFKIFKEEIDNEEAQINEAYILMDFTNHPVEIKFINYSDRLIDKMKQSFTQDDLDFIERFGGIR